MRLSYGTVIVLALLPLVLAVVGFYSAHFILNAQQRVEWASLGKHPGFVFEVVDQKNLLRGNDGKIQWHDGDEWILKSDESIITFGEYDESCPTVELPKGTIDMVQDCHGSYDRYYVIRNDGTAWYYYTEYESTRHFVQLIIKVLASAVGLAIGFGMLVFVGITGIVKLRK